MMIKPLMSLTFSGCLVVTTVVACGGSYEDEPTQSTRQNIFEEETGPFPREGECNIDDPFFDEVRDLIGRDNNIGPNTLKDTPIPEPSNLHEFVKNDAQAIALGKALFWDMQVGSDGVQACASCHFRAGADPRSKNQVHPGAPSAPGSGFDFPPNYQLNESDFPLTAFADPTDRSSTMLQDSDDVISSQGAFSHNFVAAIRGGIRDITDNRHDAEFQVNGIETRRVEPRNTPTVINAVFNHRQFWDGRAESIFNGVNPFGVRDPDARVLESTGGSLAWTTVRIDNASLASQAVGPIVNDREMAAFDRPLREVGRRLVSAKPLRLQRVHPDDSVLGNLADAPRGLDTTYQALIEAAFEERWWDADTIVVVNRHTGQTSFAPKPQRRLLPHEYTMMEWNFSLFFGLAVQMYEATLVSDDAKLDRHFDRVNQGLSGLLSHDEEEGMKLFEKAACADCHSGPELTSAAVRTTVTGFDNPDVFPSFQPPEQLERMNISSCDIAVYDQGFYNIGVRPTEEDLGLGAFDPFGNPLSISKLLTSDPQTIPSQELLTISYPSLMASGQVPAPVLGERTAVEGSFKIPSLRNVELTAPYFHNGGKRTLREVVEFYNRGGDFHEHNDAFIALGIGKLKLTEDEIDKIVLFMHTFTDERVVNQSAPFDHPELFVADGHIGNENFVVEINGHAAPQLLQIPEVGVAGGPLPASFLEN